eukprot:3722576-Amphidinium_carterae.1
MTSQRLPLAVGLIHHMCAFILTETFGGQDVATCTLCFYGASFAIFAYVETCQVSDSQDYIGAIPVIDLKCSGLDVGGEGTHVDMDKASLQTYLDTWHALTPDLVTSLFNETGISNWSDPPAMVTISEEVRSNAIPAPSPH